MSARTEENLRKTAKRLGLPPERIPRRIAIIMDGNGRWAQERGLPRVEGHSQGGKTVEKMALVCVELGVESLVLYSFSTENWKRPKVEVDALMELYEQYLVGIRPMMMKNHVRLVHLGRSTGLPARVQEALAESIQMTADNDGMVLGLALNYSGRVEIEDAIKKIVAKHKTGMLGIDDISADCISEHMYAPQLKDPDLLIRTANEMRISNFLLWQLSYTEFYVSDKYWPGFTKEDMEKAFVAYSQRQRRFGDIHQQTESSV